MNRPDFDMEAANDDEPISGEHDTLRSPPLDGEIQPISLEQKRWEFFVANLIARTGAEYDEVKDTPEYRVMYKVLEVQFGISAAKEIEKSFFESIK